MILNTRQRGGGGDWQYSPLSLPHNPETTPVQTNLAHLLLPRCCNREDACYVCSEGLGGGLVVLIVKRPVVVDTKGHGLLLLYGCKEVGRLLCSDVNALLWLPPLEQEVRELALLRRAKVGHIPHPRSKMRMIHRFLPYAFARV